MKGCPLSCLWCHNPEGISPHIEKVERIDRIGQKEFRVEEEVGIKYSIGSLLKIVEKERVFIEESGGGVTFSGGEPLMQHKFVIEAMKELRKEGVHTCLDTSGQADPGIIADVIPITDMFLLDLKHVDSTLHRKYTGVPNSKIFENYESIFTSGKDIFVRVPVVPGFNDDKENLRAMRDYLVSKRNNKLLRVDLLPYHRIGASKYRRFGMEYKMDGVEEPSSKRMKELKEYFSEPGLKVKIGG